jgi:putative hemolysin
MAPLRKGHLRVREADGAADVAACQALRAAAFRDGASDEDAFDARCRHVMVEDEVTGRLLCTYRLLPLGGGREIGRSYSAQFYDLSALEAFDAPMAEMGRFCLRPDVQDPDVVRMAWGAMAQVVDEEGVGLLFGCSSFHGTEAREYGDAFALLRARHLAPPRWRPLVKAREVVRYAARLRRKPDMRRAMAAMPPMLRSYLGLGGWVSDHAVVDRDLGTLHVFTGLEIARIPPGRARLLRRVAA